MTETNWDEFAPRGFLEFMDDLDLRSAPKGGGGGGEEFGDSYSAYMGSLKMRRGIECRPCFLLLFPKTL